MQQTYRRISGTSIFILLLILFTYPLRSQSIVVNEYNYAPDPKNQFTELLVIQDNLSIAGYTLHDNTANLDQWQSGIRFKDISLWKNLRAGTIIVINHRVNGNVTDISKADGYIEVEADDLNVFDTLTFPSGDNWKSLSLIISQNADIVQILDASGNHVHALSHGTNTGQYAALPQPKLQHPGAITGSVRVHPGYRLTDYYGTGNKTYESAANITKGLPNIGASATVDSNSRYLRSLRIPKLANESLLYTLTGNTVHLTWLPATDPNPSDNIQGYIVLWAASADTVNFVLSDMPKQGTSYPVGSVIGNWRVKANILSSQTTTYDDVLPSIPCGFSCVYRVLAFRYSQDETDNSTMSANPSYGRGRSYNWNSAFNIITVEKRPDQYPDIAASGPLSFCSGGSVTLTTTMTGVPLQWFKNNNAILGETGNSFVATTSGMYRVQAQLSNNCYPESEEKEVKVTSSPVAQITASSLLLCSGDSISLFAGSADSYEWTKDGVTIPLETKQTYYAKAVGSYRVIVKNSDGCVDTSAPTVITVRSISYSFSKNKLDFGKLSDCQSSKLDSVKVQNDTREDIRFETITTSEGYSLVSPTLPVTIRDGKTITFVFRFTPQKSDTTDGYADFVVTPCNVARRLTLTGSKDITKVALSTSSVNFGTILSCDNKGRDTTIEITNNGDIDLVISGRSVTPAAGYSLVNNITFPKTAKPKEKIPITINFSSSSNGTFSSELAISYSIGSCNDTLRVKLQGIITTPVFTTNLKNIDFIPLQACDSLRDTTLVLTNPGLIPLVISKQSVNPNIQFLNLPLVINPNLSAKLRVRFQPVSQLTIVGDVIPIVADKCNSTTNFTISGSKQGTTFSFNSDEIEFGDVTNCTQGTVNKQITLKIDGLSSGTKVSSVSAHKPFSIDLNDGQAVTDQQQVSISFAPLTIGEFTDSIGVTFEPCSIVKFIKVHGRRISTGIAITSLITDFGIVDTGTVSIAKTLEIKNTGSSPFHLNSIDGITAPFSILSTSKPYPTSLDVNESITLTVTYSPTNGARDSIPLKISIDKPCDTFLIASLVGTGRVKPPPPPPDTIKTSATIHIADGTASVGGSVIFPITIASTNISLAKIYKMTADISYNPRLLMPKAIRTGVDHSGFVTSFINVVPGQTRITIENPDGVSSTKFIKEGTVAEFECESLLGDQLSTILTISNETFARVALSTTSITEATGTFTLSGDCALDSRKIMVGGSVTLTQKSISSDNIELEFETVSEDRTTLLLYSSIGSLIQTIVDEPLKYGKHYTSIPLSSLTVGVYYVVLRTGTSMKVLPLSIQN